MSRKQMTEVYIQCDQSDSDLNYYYFQDGSQSQYLEIDHQYQEINQNIEIIQNLEPFFFNIYEQQVSDPLAIENEEFANESQGFEILLGHGQSQYNTSNHSIQSFRQDLEVEWIYMNESQEFESKSTRKRICQPNQLNINQQLSQSYQVCQMDYFNLESQRQFYIYNSYESSSLEVYDMSDPTTLNDKSSCQKCKLNEQHQGKFFTLCKKFIKENKQNDKINQKIKNQKQSSSENETLSEPQTSKKNTNQDKYKKIDTRLEQRDVKYIRLAIDYQNIIIEHLAVKLCFEKYEQQLICLKQCQSQTIRVKIIQSLYSDFSEYQNQVIGLGQIEKYVVLLIVKLTIYNFILDKNLLNGELFQNIKNDLLYFFASLSDRQVIMEQAKDYIINQKIFQLSSKIKKKITKKIMNQLWIDRQYYKSNQSGYCNYIKQEKQVIKNEEYWSFDKKKNTKNFGYVGKKDFLGIIKNDEGTIKHFTINHHYSLLNQNSGKIERLSIYMDDIFNLLILYEDLKQ